jgi:hypothetical protein
MERVRAALRSATGGGGVVPPPDGLDGSIGGAPYPPLASGLGPRSAGGAPASSAGGGAFPPPAPGRAAYARANRPSLLAGNGSGGRSSFATGVERFGVQSKGLAYFRDPFHSMVSLPTGRFYACFFAVYLALYVVFALLYLTFSDECIRGLDGRFSHALWVASRTAGECVVV